jgi:hypothetical protein
VHQLTKYRWECSPSSPAPPPPRTRTSSELQEGDLNSVETKNCEVNGLLDIIFTAFSHSDECNNALSLEKVTELQSYMLVVIYSFGYVGLKYHIKKRGGSCPGYQVGLLTYSLTDILDLEAAPKNGVVALRPEPRIPPSVAQHSSGRSACVLTVAQVSALPSITQLS